jgi:hypothetical protein
MTTAIVHHPSIPTPDRRRWRLRRAPNTAAAPADIEFTWDNRRPGTIGFARWAAAVGQRIDRHGLSESSRDVNNLIGIARRSEVSSTVADVLADSNEPDPARLRAFASIVSALVRCSENDPH